MTTRFFIHPKDPQPRQLDKIAELLRDGGVIAVPTETSYVLIARLEDKKAVETMRKIRGIDDKHLLTIICRDLSDLGTMAKVNNQQYRLLKIATPGPWTFILPASSDIPRRVSHPSRKTIGLRVPEHLVTQAILNTFDDAVIACSYIPKGESHAFNDPEDILEHESTHLLAGVVDAGPCQNDMTTIIDLCSNPPQVLRLGLGDPSLLGLE